MTNHEYEVPNAEDVAVIPCPIPVSAVKIVNQLYADLKNAGKKKLKKEILKEAIIRYDKYIRSFAITENGSNDKQSQS